MKKLVVVLLVLFLFVLVSCQNSLTQTQQHKTDMISKISTQVKQIREPILDRINVIRSELSPMTRAETTTADLDNAEEFLNNPEPKLTEISDEIKGEEKLDLISTVLDGNTGDYSEKLGAVDSSLQQEYDNQTASFNDTQSKSISTNASFKGMVNVINTFYGKDTGINRDVWSDWVAQNSGDVTTNDIIVSSGLAASAIAGTLMYKFCPFWLNIAGLVLELGSIAALPIYQIAVKRIVQPCEFLYYFVTVDKKGLTGTIASAHSRNQLRYWFIGWAAFLTVECIWCPEQIPFMDKLWGTINDVIKSVFKPKTFSLGPAFTAIANAAAMAYFLWPENE